MLGGMLTATLLDSEPSAPPTRYEEQHRSAPETQEPEIILACEDILRSQQSVLAWHKRHGKAYEPSASERTEAEACQRIIDAYEEEHRVSAPAQSQDEESTHAPGPLGAVLHFLFRIPRAYAAEGIFKAIPYQGKLTLTSGAGMANGQYNMRFKIFTAASGGNPAWTETWDLSTTRVTMTGGLFTAYLGTHVTMTGSVNFNSDNLYLEVEFDPGNDGTYEETFSPRQRFASVPYAHNADKVDGLDASQFVRSDASDVMSGALLIHQSGQSPAGADVGILLEILGTASGRILHAQDLLTSSGGIIAEGDILTHGNMSGATIAGAGLYDCQGAGNKLTYNNATKKFTCEADQGEAASVKAPVMPGT